MRINHEKVARELVRLLDEAERRERALKEHNQAERERIAEIRAQAAERRDLIAGRAGAQLSIGDADDGPTPDERAAAAALGEARERPAGKVTTYRTRKPKREAATVRCGGCGLLHRTGDGIPPSCWDSLTEEQRVQLGAPAQQEGGRDA